MPTRFCPIVDTVEVPPCAAAPLRRAVTVPCDEGLLWAASSATNDAGVQSQIAREDSYSGLCGANGQPYDYPAPVYVRNTFVVLVPGRDPSLDEFFEERRIRSCPPSWGPTTLGDCKEDDEVRALDSEETRTTACEWDSVSSTPPMELSDGEDTAEGLASPRSGPRAGCMPTSKNPKTLSGYRHSDDSAKQIVDLDDQMDRLPLPPGPLHLNSLPPLSPESEFAGYHAGFSDERYQAAFAGCYDTVYEQVYEPGRDNGYSSRHVNGASFDNSGFSAGFDGLARPDGAAFGGYHPGFASNYAQPVGQVEFVVQRDFAMPDLRTPANQHVVLQLSAAISPGSQAPPPPPPGAPAPLASSLPPQRQPAAPMAPPGPADPHGHGYSVAAYSNGCYTLDDPSVLAPTRGSIHHGLGRCKPCAFVHTKGCGNGFECPFCHLCEPGEKKKRRKEKLEVRRTMREFRQEHSYGGTQAGGGYGGSRGQQYQEEGPGYGNRCIRGSIASI